MPRHRVTKLYVKGACVSTRDNNFELSTALSNVNCGNKTNDYSATTCMDVIDNGAAFPQALEMCSMQCSMLVVTESDDQ